MSVYSIFNLREEVFLNGVRKLTPSLVPTERGQMYTQIQKKFQKNFWQQKKPPTPNGIDGFNARVYQVALIIKVRFLALVIFAITSSTKSVYLPCSMSLFLLLIKEWSISTLSWSVRFM